MTDYASGVVSKLPETGINVYSVGGNPTGMALDQSGNIWIANSGTYTLEEINTNGQLIGGPYPDGGYYDPEFTHVPYDWVYIDPSGNLWVAHNYDAFNYAPNEAPACSLYGLSGSGSVTELSNSGQIIRNYGWCLSGSTFTAMSSDGSAVYSWTQPGVAAYTSLYTQPGVAYDSNGDEWEICDNLNNLCNNAASTFGAGVGAEGADFSEWSPAGALMGLYQAINPAGLVVTSKVSSPTVPSIAWYSPRQITFHLRQIRHPTETQARLTSIRVWR